MTTDLDALIVDNRKWVQLHRENKYQREAAKRMTGVLDAIESTLAELRQERERADEAEAYASHALADRAEAVSDLSRAEETIAPTDDERRVRDAVSELAELTDLDPADVAEEILEFSRAVEEYETAELKVAVSNALREKIRREPNPGMVEHLSGAVVKWMHRRTVQGEPTAEMPTSSVCICTPAIAGISDGPNVDCPEHGERLDAAMLREAWIHYVAVGASDEVQAQKGAVFDRWIAEHVQGEPTDAQVLAALNAEGKSTHVARRPFNPAPDLNYYAIEHVEAMRAALRAAAEQGGNR